jgi:hypothetical protein
MRSSPAPLGADPVRRFRSGSGSGVPEETEFSQKISTPPVNVGDHVASRHVGSAWQQQKMHVSYSFIERYGVDPLGHNNSLERCYSGMERRSQSCRLGCGELGQRLAVPAGLNDELPWVGEWAGVMADEPQAIVEDDPTRGRHHPCDFRACATCSISHSTAHEARAIRSLSTQTFVAKKSRIIAR